MYSSSATAVAAAVYSLMPENKFEIPTGIEDVAIILIVIFIAATILAAIDWRHDSNEQKKRRRTLKND